jgi:hypothetical protein
MDVATRATFSFSALTVYHPQQLDHHGLRPRPAIVEQDRVVAASSHGTSTAIGEARPRSFNQQQENMP